MNYLSRLSAAARLQRTQVSEPEPFRRETDRECSRCGGSMYFGRLACSDPEHGDACTELHFGYECSYCGLVDEESNPYDPPSQVKGLKKRI